MKVAFQNSLVCAALLAGGCVMGSSHPHGMPPGQAKKIGHEHGAYCNHIYLDGIWVGISTGHSHGSGCGHFLKGGVWHAEKGKGKGKGKKKGKKW